jgi:predicted phage tail protein
MDSITSKKSKKNSKSRVKKIPSPIVYGRKVGGNIVNEYLVSKDVNTKVRRSMRVYKKKDITIRYIPNILKDEGRLLNSISYNRNWSILEYLKKSGFEFKDMRISVNGHEVKDLKTRLIIGDEILIARPVNVFLIPAAMTFWIAVANWTLLALTVISVGYAIYQACTAQKAKTPNFGTTGEGLDEGQSYAWDGVRTTADVGRPIPVIYGERVVGGNVLNEYVSSNGDKSYLHTLLGIGWGEIESVTLRRINRNMAANYTGWELTTRLGTIDQSVIPNFHDSHNLISINIPLTKNNAYVYTTDGNDVEAVELHFSIAGLNQQDSSGNTLSWDIVYKVEYRLYNVGNGAEDNWIDLGSTTISKKTRNTFKNIYRKDGLTAGQYDFRITKTSDDSSDLTYPITSGEISVERIDEISCEDEQIFPMLAIAGIDSLALEQLSGAFPDYELLIKGRKISTPKVMNGAVDVSWEDYYWDPDDECYKLLADDTALTWDGVTFTTAYSANPVWCTYDLEINRLYGAGHYITALDNNLSSLIEHSQYCDERVSDGAGGWEKRFRMDIVIDSQQKALDLIVQMCSAFRAYPFYSDKGQVRLVVEKPEIPVQLFSPGNTIEKSFSESWGSKRDIPNVVNVQFDDENRNYETQTIQAYVDDEALIANRPLNPVTIRYYGVKESYAIRHGRNYFKALKYISNTIKLKSALGSVIRQCGEVVDIANDIPQWGFGGTVKADFVYKGNYDSEITYAINDAVTWTDSKEYKALHICSDIDPTNATYWVEISRTKIKLDRAVVIEGNKSYAVRVDFARGGYEERIVTDASGSYTEVNVSVAFSKTPIAYDIYSFGELNKVVKPGRIMGISRDKNGEIEFEIPEYDEDIYDDSMVIIPQKKLSSLSLSIPDVTNLKLTERLVVTADGKIEDAIDVWFDKPNMSNYMVSTFVKVKVYLSDNDGASWVNVGETSGAHLSIVGGLRDLQSYKVAVVTVSIGGEKDIAFSPQSSILVIGKSAPPSDVSTFLVNQARDKLMYGWTEVDDLDVKTGGGYEIRYGSSWDGGTKVDEDVTIIKGNKYVSYFLKLGDSQSFWIKAIDSSGNYSLNALEAVITIDNIPFTNIIESYSEAPTWGGSFLNTKITLDSLALRDNPTHAELAAYTHAQLAGKTHGAMGPGSLSGTYITPVRDVGYVATFKIAIEAVVVDASSLDKMSDNVTERMNDDLTERMSGSAVTGATSYRIRTSEDNITWTAWKVWQAGDYKCRYFQLELTLTRTSLSKIIQCTQFDYYADLPDIDEIIEGELTDADTGETIVFVKVFHQPPTLNVDILSGDGYVKKFVSEPDTSGCVFKLYDLGGVSKTGRYRAVAHGI